MRQVVPSRSENCRESEGLVVTAVASRSNYVVKRTAGRGFNVSRCPVATLPLATALDWICQVRPTTVMASLAAAVVGCAHAAHGDSEASPLVCEASDTRILEWAEQIAATAEDVHRSSLLPRSGGSTGSQALEKPTR